MTTTLLLAAAARGKTHRLVELLVKERSSTRPRWAILPDRLQAAAFRRRVALAGGALGVQVGTFGDLFHEILARAGRSVAITPDPARQRILRLVLQQLVEAGELSLYLPIVGTAGLLEALGEAFGELRRARIEPEAVSALAGSRSPRLAEVGRAYAAYRARLQAIGWTDREGLNDSAIQALSEDRSLLADVPLVVVDGFDSFESAQLEALGALDRQVERLIVTLPGSLTMDRAAFRRFAEPLRRLRSALPEAGIEELKGPGRLPPPLDRLEAGLFERGGVSAGAEGASRVAKPRSPADPEGVIQRIEARSPAEEAREALRWVKARIVRDGLALQDCALITPDPGRYRPLLRRAAVEFGLRLRFTQGEQLIGASPVAALLDLLELSRTNWPRRTTLQTIRSPYFDLTAWGLRPVDAVALDAASVAGQVVEGLEQWREALERFAKPRGLTDGEAEADPGLAESELPAFIPPKSEAARRLLASLEALAARLAPGEDRSATRWVVWLEDLLDDLGFPERTMSEGERPAAPRDDLDRAAFLRLRETLRALVLGELVTGGDDLPYEAFLDELRGLLEAATFHEDLPLNESAVSVMSPLEARGARYPAVAVLGLSEGLLPEVEREDPLLDEPTRAALGLEPRLGREQGGLFYQAVTRADARLLLTRPYLAEDGENWEPSPFWRAVEGLLDEPSLRIRPEDPRPLAEAASLEELLFSGVRRGGLPASLHEPLVERWTRLQHARDVLAARSASEAAGPHEGNLGELAEALSARFGLDHTWSPSRLESYGSCPHMFWTANLLRLEAREPPQPGLNPAQLGSLLHDALEAAYRGADDPTDPETVLVALERELEPIFELAPEVYGFRPTPLWAIERQQYSQALRDTILALAEEGSGWTPTGFELAFGDEAHPPLDLQADGETVLLRGFIDRVDRRADGGLRVIDYKTGAGRLNQRELDQGRRLQLPLYAQGAQEALGLGKVVDGFYWAILAAKSGALRLAGYRAPEQGGASGIEGAYAAARREVARIVAGVRSGQFEPVAPPGGCPSYCPASAWCWRYRPGPWG